MIKKLIPIIVLSAFLVNCSRTEDIKDNNSFDIEDVIDDSSEENDNSVNNDSSDADNITDYTSKLEGITDYIESSVVMTTSCQSVPEEPFIRNEYGYDKSRNLISETIYSFNRIDKKIYKYDSSNKITGELIIRVNHIVDSEYIYNEDNQLVKIVSENIECDSTGLIISKTESEKIFEYENGLLVRSTDDWGYFMYEYNTKRQLIKMINYTQYGVEYHITHYNYSDDLKTEEWKETTLGNLLYFHRFYYDSESRLVKVTEDDNIIEESLYENSKLVEKKEYYYGRDPGHSPCGGNFIYRYKYYADNISDTR